MKHHHYQHQLIWTGNLGSGTSGYAAYTRDHVVAVAGKPDILGSSDPTFRGDPTRHNPEDLFVASISSCHMLWYLGLCAHAGVTVLSYRDAAEGVMVEEKDGSGRFVSVTLRPEAELAPGSDERLAAELHHQAHAKCFIANSVNFRIEVAPSLTIGGAELRGAESRKFVAARQTCLLVIDVQRGFDDESWGQRNNPEAEGNIVNLLAVFRQAALPIFHVHHDSVSPSGSFVPGTPGNLPKPEAVPLAGEPIYRKTVNSAFIGTDLERDLRAACIASVVIVGLTTNHCVSTTARMAGNFGFDTIVVSDATATFARANLDGTMRPAEAVHHAALSDLQGEFATIMDTDATSRLVAAL